ncbi:MAG TPA: CpsD/CapB family tyrosine-protein kinase [Candidatus Polarisedimenticolia bacterium]|jgi:Mrp family chromosome partitioning ATPase
MERTGWIRSEMLVALYDQTSMAGEQFRKLQVKLRALRHATGGSLSSIVVTSPLMGEGKTACAVNLALALSHDESDRRVLLIDCDVRKPKVSSYLDRLPARGLLDVLDGRLALGEAVTRMPGDTLDVLAMPPTTGANGGRPHTLPIEKLKVLLGTLRTVYEFVVCDAPPVLPTADAAGLVNICDGALMVVRAGVTPRPAAGKALGAIDKQKLVGFLLNAVPESRMGRYYYKYYEQPEEKP